MTRLVQFLGRRTASAKPEGSPPPQGAGTQGEIELDSDLFFPIATQLGQENEAIRNLLMAAEHKIGELEAIKCSIANLVEPVAKTLRSYEEVKNEKLNLQGALNATRVAHGKLRDELSNTEKKAVTLETEVQRLRELATLAQQSVAALEGAKAEQVAELSTRRAQIAELQRQTQQQGTELQLTRDENRRIGERFAGADKRMVQLEAEAQAAQQKAMQATNERIAVQAALDKALNDYTQTARKLTDTDKTLTATQARLKAMETALAEVQVERTRLSAALDDARHKNLEDNGQQNSRFETLQARASLTETLLEEARQALMARAEEVAVLERRVTDTSDAHGSSGERLAQASSSLTERELQIKDLEQSQTALSEQNQMLTNAVSARESAFNRIQQKLKEQEELVALLEDQLKSAREAGEQQAEQLNAQIQRERIERAMAEGALESGRKDLGRLMREIAALQHRPETAAPAAPGGTPAAGKASRLKSAA